MTSSKKSSVSPLTLLIDADLYLYRACAAAEEEIDWGNDVWSLSADLKAAKQIFRDRIQSFCEMFQTAHFVLCISDSENFRKELSDTYKGGRKKVRKPVGYKALVEWAKENYTWHSEPLLEADDVMGILATAPDANAIIISDDKDMKSLPVRLYRPMSEERLTITEDEANKWWWIQTLTGDATDGYSGCKSVGPKTAEKILGARPTWETVVAAFIKNGMTAEDALLQARLARILRYEDWDMETSTIKLWEPSDVRA